MKIKLSAFADEAAHSIDGQIDALKKFGIKLIELRNIDGKNVKDFSVGQAKEYKKKFDESDIKVWSIGSPIGKVDISVDFNRYLSVVRHIFNIAEVFECDKIRVFSFFNAYDKESEVFERLNLMCNEAGIRGIELYHENEKEIYGDTVERVLSLKNNVKGLKLVFDPANFVQVGENIDNAIEKLLAVTGYFYIKDVISSVGELVPAGLGDGKIGKIIASIKDDKTLTLEPHLALFDGYGEIDKTELKNKYKFSSNIEAFGCTVSSLKDLLLKAGYVNYNGDFIK